MATTARIMGVRRYVYFSLVLLTAWAGAARAQNRQAETANTVVLNGDTLVCDSSALSFGTMFLAEPGDTLMVFQSSPEDSAAFAGQDTVNVITEEQIAGMADTLDFRNYIPTTPYDLTADRISCLQDRMTMPLTFNKTVNSFINYFTVRNRVYTRRVLQRRDYFFPLFERKLQEYGLPDELKYLSIVESALLNRAVSRSAAVGLWQFMAGTGRDLRLHQDKYLDERMDPEKATEAACKYLKFLYGLFGDWELALAAYNCGPGAIKRTMQRTGGKTFWEIYNHLPAETRSYVPQFVAVTYTMNYAGEHNLFAHPDSLLRPIAGDTVVVDRQVNLAALSRHLDVDIQHLIQLNPTLRKPVTPEKTPYVLTLPTEAAQRFRLERFCFLDSAAGEPIADSEGGRHPRRARASVGDGARIAHRVRRGETLTEIAKDFGVSVTDLKRWNHLRSNRVRAGQVVMVRARTRSRHQPQEDRTATAHNDAKAAKDGQTHEVQPGDTLWNISRRYELSVEKLIELNNLKDKNLKPGQRLVLG